MSVYNRASDDTSTASDANTGAGTQFNAPVSEVVSAQDVVGSIYSLGSSVSETVVGTDVTLGNVNPGGVFVTEAATISDAVLSVPNYKSMVNESVTGTDASISGLNFKSEILESVIGQDASASVFVFPVNTNESAVAQDNVQSIFSIGGKVSESASAADVDTALMNFKVMINEIVTATVVNIASGMTFDSKVTELVTASDVIGGAYLWNPVDDDQTPNWQNLNDDQTPGWSTVDDSQTTTWTNIPTVN